jgi:hypothetical protein
MSILTAARNKQTAQSIRKWTAEIRVRRCEEDLQNFQRDLLHIDDELQQTENSIGQLQELALSSQQERSVKAGGNITLHMQSTVYGSNSSLGSQ